MNFTEITDLNGRPTGSVDNGDVVIHWDGPGYYAAQAGAWRVFWYRLVALDGHEAGREARLRGLGTPRWMNSYEDSAPPAAL